MAGLLQAAWYDLGQSPVGLVDNVEVDFLMLRPSKVWIFLDGASTQTFCEREPMLPKLFHPLRHLGWGNSRHRAIPRAKARHLARDPDDLRQAKVQKGMVDPIAERYHTASNLCALFSEARQVWLGLCDPQFR